MMLSKKSHGLPPLRPQINCDLHSTKGFQGRVDAPKWSEVSGDGKKESEKVKEKEKFRCADLRPNCPRTEDCAAIHTQGKLYVLRGNVQQQEGGRSLKYAKPSTSLKLCDSFNLFPPKILHRINISAISVTFCNSLYNHQHL